MNITDPIADMLTRIRNGQMARHAQVRAPGCKINMAVAEVLRDNGYVSSATWVDEGPQGWVEVALKYSPSGDPVIRGIRRESTPGQRRYVKKKDIPLVLGGLGITILSTSQGVMTGQKAKETSTGGEFLATVW